MTDPLLLIDELTYAWPGEQDPVIRKLSLSIAAGEKVFLAGASGSGKSTLLALIGGLVLPDQGTIDISGQSLNTLSRSARDRFRADHLGVIFQQFNLLPWLDVVGNVTLGCHFSALRRKRTGAVRSAAEALLKAMDLEQRLWHKRADQLSVGQQQRVAAARALIGQPDLVLADEPTSALDRDRRDAFLSLLFREIDRAGSALLFVSHDHELAARFDRTLELSELNGAACHAIEAGA